MAKDKKSTDKNFYAVTKGKNCGIFKQWSQVKPLVDKYPGAAFKGFNALHEAMDFMIMGGIEVPNIMVYEDTLNLGTAESVTEFASRNGISLSALTEENTQHPEEIASDSETEEKFLDAAEGVTVYVDGCCFNNGNTGASCMAGIGVYWGPDHNLNVSEPIIHGKRTNNAAELLSAIKALEQIKENNLTDVMVKSDSRYVIDGISKWIIKWKSNNWITSNGSEVENRELWVRLDTLNTETNPKWQHIAREYNVHADRLSKGGANMEIPMETTSLVKEKQSVSNCVICTQEATRDVLLCSSCSKRVHFKCSGLPNYQVAVFRKSQRKYTCEICVVGAGNVNASDARKSCGGSEAEQLDQHMVNSPVQYENSSLQGSCVKEFKCIKEELADIKTSLGTFESEILKVVSQLCEENIQMKERLCEEKYRVAEKENKELVIKVQKGENREKELRVQLDNLRDKNAKLSAECENLRANIARRKETDSELKSQLTEKDSVIKDLQSNLQLSQRNGMMSRETQEHGEDQESYQPTLQSQSNVKVSNRFEHANTQKDETSFVRRKDTVYIKGHTEPLSNFYRMKFRWQRKTLHSLEQAFQYEKASRHGDFNTAERVMKSKHAGIANKIGREVKLHPQWDREKEHLMYSMLQEKTNQSDEFRDELVRTGERDIDVNVPDRFWGIGRDGKGRNVLGLMLTDIRREIKSSGPRGCGQKPVVAVIGSSLIKNLQSDKFSRHFHTDVRKAYTIPEAKSTVRDYEESTDVIVYQVLSNDMKVKTEDDCLSSLKELVAITKEVQPGAKIIVSLPPNRGDSKALNNKTNIINASVKSLFTDDHVVTVCDNSNLSYRGEPSRRHICRDGVHPTPTGERVLFGNIRQAIMSVLAQ